MIDDLRLPSHFWSKVSPEPNSGCWLWLASVHPAGHGKFKLDGVQRYSHVVAYTALVGPVPPPLVLDHLCRTPSCCNPSHLEPVTQRVNTLRGVGMSANRLRQTHCKRGHELAGANLYKWRTSRICRACRSMAMKVAA